MRPSARRCWGSTRSNQFGLDGRLCELDSTPRKSKLGGNAIAGRLAGRGACRRGGAGRAALSAYQRAVAIAGRRMRRPYAAPPAAADDQHDLAAACTPAAISTSRTF